jgi:cytochrome c-type biogenesis protein CcmH
MRSGGGVRGAITRAFALLSISKIARPLVIAIFVAVLGLPAILALPAMAREALPEAADPALEARMVRITGELRCLVCQNQTIADSHADLAVDLRNQVREQLRAGRTDAQIVDYMTARYGDFVLYRPPFKATTVLLWLGPALMLGGGLAVLALVLRRRARLPAEAFEADDDDAPSAHGA